MLLNPLLALSSAEEYVNSYMALKSRIFCFCHGDQIGNDQNGQTVCLCGSTVIWRRCWDTDSCGTDKYMLSFIFTSKKVIL